MKMNIKEKAIKTKEFAKEHKKELIIGAVVFGAGVVGYKLGCRKFKDAVFLDEHIDCLLSTTENFTGYDLYTGICDKALKPEELGELGKAIVEKGGENGAFTHFIAIGEIKEK